ncbi:MAG: hypothetical protein OEW50_08230 [Gammaproteobacteria bacterium]|nr:hypothetical protein [Gammaproteobacteria bacterium]
MAATAREHYSIYLLALVTALGVVPSARAVTSDVPIQVLDQLDVFSATNLKRSTETPVRFDDLN